METIDNKEVRLCERCNAEMQSKKIPVEELDVNNVSLLAMFRVQEFVVHQCSNCNHTGLYV